MKRAANQRLRRRSPRRPRRGRTGRRGRAPEDPRQTMSVGEADMAARAGDLEHHLVCSPSISAGSRQALSPSAGQASESRPSRGRPCAGAAGRVGCCAPARRDAPVGSQGLALKLSYVILCVKVGTASRVIREDTRITDLSGRQSTANDGDQAAKIIPRRARHRYRRSRPIDPTASRRRGLSRRPHGRFPPSSHRRPCVAPARVRGGDAPAAKAHQRGPIRSAGTRGTERWLALRR
jgi:hypothetical protein